MTAWESFCQRFKKTVSALFKKPSNTEKAALGDEGEKAALKYLLKRGYRLLEANFRYSHSEIDLIVEDRDKCVVFCEVRTQSVENYLSPAESITENKRASISRGAAYYLANIHEYGTYNDYLEAQSRNFPCRFDVIEVYAENGHVKKINHIKDAFFKTRKTKKGRYRI